MRRGHHARPSHTHKHTHTHRHTQTHTHTHTCTRTCTCTSTSTSTSTRLMNRFETTRSTQTNLKSHPKCTVWSTKFSMLLDNVRATLCITSTLLYCTVSAALSNFALHALLNCNGNPHGPPTATATTFCCRSKFSFNV